MTIKTMSNEQVVKLYQEGNEVAAGELIRRFTISSRKEAKILLNMYGDVTSAEFEDLVQVGLHSLIIAMNSYSFIGNFYSYWLAIAKNEMMELIKEFVLHYSVKDGAFARIEANLNNIDLCFASDDRVIDEVNNGILLDSLHEILSNPRDYDIRPIDAKMFKMHYFDDKSVTDIALMTGCKYFTVRNRIMRVKDKISFILFNSKE